MKRKQCAENKELECEFGPCFFGGTCHRLKQAREDLRAEFERAFRLICPEVPLDRRGDSYQHLKAYFAWIRWEDDDRDNHL